MSRALVKPSGDVVERPKRTDLRLWVLAVGVGAVVGLAVVVFSTLVAYSEFLFFGATDQRLAARIAGLPWVNRVVPPVVGGALVALLLRLGVSQGWGPKPRAFGLEDVVGARRMRGTIRATTLSLRDTFLSTLISIIALGAGASAGRECPSMHLGASLAILPGRLFGLPVEQRRLLVGMGAAAALAAVLHAPIAGVILARELLLPKQRLATLGPVAAASMVAWLVARVMGGDAPVLAIPAIVGHAPVAILAVAPVVAVALALAAVMVARAWIAAPPALEALAARLHIPVWLLPAIGGALTGVVALTFPPVVGIGYAPVTAAIGGQYNAALLIVFALAKTAAAAIAIAFRLASGRIAPALYIGAMIGSAIGFVVGLAVGETVVAPVVFAVVGMAVVLAVVLRAPLTAAAIAIELAGSVEVSVVALVSVGIATFVARQLQPSSPAPSEQQPLYWR